MQKQSADGVSLYIYSRFDTLSFDTNFNCLVKVNK